VVDIFVTPGAFYQSIIDKVIISGNEVAEDYTEADMIIFSGGEDISPSIYNEENRHSYFNPERDMYEINVYKHAISNGLPMLGICRGHQLLLALNGAKLVQDISIELGFSHPGFHKIEVEKLNSIIPVYVNSLHHQGVLVKDIPDTFELVAYEPNTMIAEATYNETLGIFTVQFHPEILSDDTFINIIHFLEDNHE